MPARSPLLVAAAGGYLLNCALGAAVAARVLDTSGVRWVHHGLYVTTATLTAAAGLDLARRRSGAFWRLLPQVAQRHGIRLFEASPTDESLESVFSYLVTR